MGVNMKRILITAIGSLTGDAVIQTLREQGHYVVGTDIYPKEWIANAQMVHTFYNVPLSINEEHYIDSLLKICSDEKIDFLFPLTDLEIDVLNVNRSKFESIRTCLCMSGTESIRICRNKRISASIIGQSALCNMIPDYSAEEIEMKDIYFPILCKPINGRSSQGIKIFYEDSDFYSFYNKANPKLYLFQPYIAGNVITVDVVRNPKTNHCFTVARKELLRTLNGAGLSVQVFQDNAFGETCKKLAEKLNITGCVNFEFIETKNGLRYFLECNPRFSGGVKFSSISGYDFITNHLNCFEGKDIETNAPIRECWISRKYEEYITG